MIKLENYEVVGWEHAIRGMRNPMNSWAKMDSQWTNGYLSSNHITVQQMGEYDEFQIGPNDRELMMKLAKGGPVHAKYRRMITVYVDITAPLYWWKEFDTYKVGTVANSCSTMHKIHSKEFTLEDFSCEKLLGGLNHYDERAVPYIDVSPYNDGSIEYSPRGLLGLTIKMLNECRKRYLEYDGCDGIYKKELWHQMIQLLPTSYNQRRTVMFNYEVLHNIYTSGRKSHKIDEWRELCAWIEKLPYSETITGKEGTDE